MKYIIGAHTDVGIKKSVNQDAISIKVAETPYDEVLMGTVCDGLGGLDCGEIASSYVLKKFTEWFSNQLVSILNDSKFEDVLKSQWYDLVFDLNNKLLEYGKEKNMKLGTTLTNILVFKGKYYVIHIGDTRLYEINRKIKQLTNDHTLVAREVSLGHITMEQAKNDKRKNVLLQCIGVTPKLEPDFFSGKTSKNTVYLLCSDGFRHKISENEILDKFSPAAILSKDDIVKKCREVIEIDKQRMETDNITAGVIKII
ncbi:MAG: PP2C family protein-serine/threonine phosphatase [Hominimerdicola sp.]